MSWVLCQYSTEGQLQRGRGVRLRRSALPAAHPTQASMSPPSSLVSSCQERLHGRPSCSAGISLAREARRQCTAHHGKGEVASFRVSFRVSARCGDTGRASAHPLPYCTWGYIGTPARVDIAAHTLALHMLKTLRRWASWRTRRTQFFQQHLPGW